MNIRIHSVVWFIQLIIWDELINTLSNLVTEERILSVFCVDSFLFQQVRFTLISQFLQELSNSTLHQRQPKEKALIHRCDSVFFFYVQLYPPNLIVRDCSAPPSWHYTRLLTLPLLE